MVKRGPTIAETARRLIEERGPMTLRALADELVALGQSRSKNPIGAVRQAVQHDAWLVEGENGRWHSLPAQLEGSIFVVSPTLLERSNGVVLVRDDIWPARTFLDHGRYRKGDGELHLDVFGDFFDLPFDDPSGEDPGAIDLDDPDAVRAALGDELAATLLGFLEELGLERDDETDDDEALAHLIADMGTSELIHGPVGWMPLLRPRELLGLRITDGTMHALPVDRRELRGMHVEEAAAALAATARQRLGTGPDRVPVIPVVGLMELMVTEAPGIFRRPLPPVADLLAGRGLEVELGLIGLPGTQWDDVLWALDPDPEAAWGYDPGDAVN